MLDTMRGAAAIVGIGELQPQRTRPDRDTLSLLTEACFAAIQDAGLKKSDIDGLIMEPEIMGSASGFNAVAAEHMGIFPTWATGCDVQGAGGVVMALQAAAYVNAGLADFVLCGTATPIDPNGPRGDFPRRTETAINEFTAPFGPVVAANGWYAMIASRHEALYGTTVEKRAKIAVDQRYNANHNPWAIFYDAPITVQDVVNSRIVSDPLHLLECVMPVSGACAFVVTRAEIAQGMRHQPAYVLGGAHSIERNHLAHVGEITIAPAGRAARKAFRMAGYGPRDMQLLEIYDSYTITVICELEDAGFCEKGEGGDWIQEQDLTFKGNLPLNTHGGQISYGQAALAGGCSHVTEAVRQIRRTAGERQVPGPTDIALVTGSGGLFSQQSAMVLSSDEAL